MPAPPGRKPRETLFEPRFAHPGLFLLPVILLPTASIFGMIVLHRILPGFLPPIALPLAGAAAVVCLVVWWIMRLRRTRSLIRAHAHFLCLNCHYPLTGLPDAGVCPECEQPYQREVTERRWRTWEETINQRKTKA